MIVYDGIIGSLQPNGGISVLFEELKARLSPSEFKYYSYTNEKGSLHLKSRIMERYRDFGENLELTDLFHSTYYRLPDSACNIVTTVHDFTYERYIGGLAKFVHSFQKNRAIKKSDQIICVSENTALDLLKYCPVDESRINVVYNGVSNDYYPLKSSYSGYVVFVGSRAKYKNFECVVESVALISDLKLVIVGGGTLTSNELGYLNTKLNGRYEHKGFIANTALNAVYNDALALVYPSSYEGFGIPVIEAMKAGCPVIALNSSSIPEVAGNSAILLETPSVDEVREAIVALDSGIIRNNMVSQGLENAKRFSWDKCFEETQKVYSKLI
ncbi:glycosyltransferase family 4 protein [Vibrio parahaemolyticus]|uniref:Alpha-maltose-1-phosphate synthase n=1 Tax=Vibrio parahaemolyticus TaxID=670 RepID=A0A7M1VP98_VIBPH|nr:glycosyltransferase family 4 protein [Vibrio parahaemolyticus]QOS16369.1 alpha-maltose-1-phosphate synthase [Vibrio parahaemolyticus]